MASRDATVARRSWRGALAGMLALGMLAALAAALPTAPAAADAAGRGGDFVPLTVTRVLDTRDGTGGIRGAVGQAGTISFTVLGRAGVPTDGVRAVLIDVSPITPTANTWFQVWPNGKSQPIGSVVSAQARQIISTTAVVPVGSDGRLALYNRWGSAHAAVDVHGYFTDTPSPDTGRGGFVATPHTGILDTRYAVGAPKAQVPGKGSLTLQVTGSLVPAGANAVALDIGVGSASTSAWLRAYPTGGAMGTSLLDFVPGWTSTNAVVKLGSGGRITFKNEASTPIDIFARVQGYFSASPTVGAGFRPTQGRVLDTRTSGVKVPANGTVDVQIGGMFGAPTRGIASAALNLTIAEQTAVGHLKAWPLGEPEPNISLANFPATYYRESLAFVQVGTDGRIRVRNVSAAPAHIDIELVGWFADPVPSVAPRQYAPTAAVQASALAGADAGKLVFAWVDNTGLLMVGTQAPDNGNSLVWAPVGGTQPFSGPPSIGQQPDGRLHVAAQHRTSDEWVGTQDAAGATAWTLTNTGGSMATPPVVGALPDGRLALFAADADGKLWFNAQATANGPYAGWRALVDLDITGGLAVASVTNGIRIVGIDARGALQTTVFFAGGTVSGWQNLGGVGLTGTPALVTYPGDLVRLFVRQSDGTIVTKIANFDGTFPAAWTPVPGLVAAGSPTAVVSPTTGKTEVLARDATGRIYGTGEVTPASGTWRPWIDFPSQSVAAATDPTAFVFSYNGIRLWAVVYRDADTRMYFGDVGPTTTGAKVEAPRAMRVYDPPKR